jgi:hypothetical protein
MSQQNVELPVYEQKISEIFDTLRKTTDDERKMKINHGLLSLFDEILSLDSSFYYPFDSLKNMGKIYSSDTLVRIYSWNLPLSNGTHKYFVYFQHLERKNGPVQHVFLYNKSNNPPDSVQIYNSENWYGALYYQVLRNECESRVSYTVLGFRFNDYLTNSKIIDEIVFTETDIEFGSPVFRSGNKVNNRVVFEYSARVAMMLRYDSEHQMIVFDHLSPTEPQYKGKYQFYGPDSSYDGYRNRSCFWDLEEDLDLKNKKNP